jgi:hypothetical protein
MVALDGNVDAYEMECNRMLQYNMISHRLVDMFRVSYVKLL